MNLSFKSQIKSFNKYLLILINLSIFIRLNSASSQEYRTGQKQSVCACTCAQYLCMLYQWDCIKQCRIIITEPYIYQLQCQACVCVSVCMYVLSLITAVLFLQRDALFSGGEPSVAQQLFFFCGTKKHREL